MNIAGGTNLIQYTGTPLPYSRSLAPNETLHFVNRYKAVAESAAANDIVVTASFVENSTGWSDESEATATAVRVEVRPQVEAPENDCVNRHRFGILEIVECHAKPTMNSLRWICAAGGSLTNGANIVKYTCPIRSQQNGIQVSGGGATYAPNIEVVEPCGVVARNVGYEDKGLGAGQAGGILLTMTLHALPLDVSFSNVKMEEIPDVGGQKTGYFADVFFMREWLHGKDQNAGIWRSVFGDNQFMADSAGFEQVLPQLDETGSVSMSGTNGWTNGVLSWQVPCGWSDNNVKEDDEPVGTFAQDAVQEMSIDGNGECEVCKYSNSVRRTIAGQKYLNGVLIQ